MMCVSIQKRHKWQPSSLKHSICASYRLFLYGLCKDEREMLGERQQKACPQVTLTHNDLLQSALTRTWEVAGGTSLGTAELLGTSTLLLVPTAQPQGCPCSPALPISSPHNSSWLSLEAGVTTAFLACFWLTAWHSLQVSGRYCLKMQPSVPWTSCTTQSIRVLPEGHPMWPANLLSVTTVRQREVILTEVVQEKKFVSVQWISKHSNFEVGNNR